MHTITTWIGPLLALCLLAATATAAEDGDGPKPIKGTVASTTATGIVVTVADDDGAETTHSVELAAGATVRNGKDTIALTDLPVGAAVMVKLDAEGKASTVRLLKAKGEQGDKGPKGKKGGEEAKARTRGGHGRGRPRRRGFRRRLRRRQRRHGVSPGGPDPAPCRVGSAVVARGRPPCSPA